MCGVCVNDMQMVGGGGGDVRVSGRVTRGRVTQVCGCVGVEGSVLILAMTWGVSG